jgi:hypothetical protein
MRAGDLQTVVSNIANVHQARHQAANRMDVVPREATLEAQERQQIRDKSVNQSEEPEKPEIRSREERPRQQSASNKGRDAGEEDVVEEISEASASDQFRGHILDVEA